MVTGRVSPTVMVAVTPEGVVSMSMVRWAMAGVSSRGRGGARGSVVGSLPLPVSDL